MGQGHPGQYNAGGYITHGYLIVFVIVALLTIERSGGIHFKEIQTICGKTEEQIDHVSRDGIYWPQHRWSEWKS